MKETRITKHARDRIVKGDRFGLRTKLTPEQVVSLIHDSHALKIGQSVYIYSTVDNKTYEVITARQKSVVITMFDTRRYDSRIPDMVMRARAGQPVEFSEPPHCDNFKEDQASEVFLGTYKEKKERLHITELVGIGSFFGFFRDKPGVLECKLLHETIVAATTDAINAGLVSKTQARKLCFFIDDQKNAQIGMLPVWVSFTLLGQDCISSSPPLF